MEPRFNEVAGDGPNLFVKWRVRYIEVLFHTFYCNFGRDIEIISFVISRTSLNRGSLNRGSTVLGNLLFGDGSDQIKALHVGFIVCVSNPVVHCNDSYDNFFIHIPFSPNAVIENHRLETEIYHDCAT